MIAIMTLDRNMIFNVQMIDDDDICNMNDGEDGPL